MCSIIKTFTIIKTSKGWSNSLLQQEDISKTYKIMEKYAKLTKEKILKIKNINNQNIIQL